MRRNDYVWGFLFSTYFSTAKQLSEVASQDRGEIRQQVFVIRRKKIHFHYEILKGDSVFAKIFLICRSRAAEFTLYGEPGYFNVPVFATFYII